MAHGTVLNQNTTNGDTVVDYDLAAGGAYPTTGKVPGAFLAWSVDTNTAPTPVTTAHPLPVSLPAATVTTLTPPAAITGFALDATLSTLSAKVPALGQALAAGSVPVVLTAVQLAALTPPSSVGITGSVAVTGTFFQATQPVSLASLPALAAGTNVIGHVVVDTLPALPAGANVVGGVTQSGTWTVGIGAGSAVIGHVVVDTLPSLPAGANVIGGVTQSGTWNVGVTGTVPVSGTFWQATQPVSGAFFQATQPVSVATLPALAAGSNTIGSVVAAPATSGGTTPFRLVSAATTNATSVKGSAGQVYGWAAFNTNATAWRYLKLYDSASAPTVGTTTVVHTIGLPPNGGSNVALPVGIAFASGIGIAVTTGMADADTGAVGAAEVAVNLTYK